MLWHKACGVFLVWLVASMQLFPFKQLFIFMMAQFGRCFSCHLDKQWAQSWAWGSCAAAWQPWESLLIVHRTIPILVTESCSFVLGWEAAGAGRVLDGEGVG